MNKKDLFLAIFLTIVFTLIIFIIKNYYFHGVTNLAEEQYIDKSIYLDLKSGDKETTTISKKNTQETSQIATGITITETDEKSDFSITYIPEELKQKIIIPTYMVNLALKSSILNKIIDGVGVEFNENTYDVRGKMKDGKLKLFGVLNLKKSELFSVFIHELGHYVDIYYLDCLNLTDVDPSYMFYNIAWSSTTVMKSSLTQKDFVSGYSMTNKYEDFAESFVYYILHNGDFKEKAKSSVILTQKYDFFGKYLFKNGEFTDVDFGNGDKIKDYYRDITKIDVNIEKILQYFRKFV